MSVRSSLALLCAVAAGCSTPTPLPVAQPGEAPSAAPVTVDTIPAPRVAPESSVKPVVNEAPAPPLGPSPAPVVTFSGAFATPESVLYDAAGDRYLVSNVNGRPDGVDGNGFIAELSPDGAIKTPKLIAGGVGGVKLDAPKGLAIVGKELWVTDISVVRRFDLKTLLPRGDVALPEATFANDLVAAPDGRVYVSDSSVQAGEKGFVSRGGDQVLVIDRGGHVKVLAKSKDLNGPNGLALGPQGLLVNTLNANEVFRLGLKGEKTDVLKLPNGGLDGLLVVADTLFCSSWGGSVVYRGKLGGTTFEPIIQNVKGPADLGWDSKRHRLLVPRFLDDRVEVFEVK